MKLLYALQALRTPAGNVVMGLITRLGEEAVFVLLAVIIFWCVSKRGGYYLIAVGLLGTVANQWLKLACRIPRPWVLDPEFSIVESARAAAGGYSFPSGHTQSAVSAFGGLARPSRRRGQRAALIAVVVLVAFSRMYLGVHTPLDVGASLLIGTALVLGLWPLMGREQAGERSGGFVLLAGILCCAGFLLYAQWGVFPAEVDAENLRHGQENAWKLTGAAAGLLVAWWIEHRYVRFDPTAVWWAQAAKTVAGFGAVAAVSIGMKGLLAACPIGAGAADAVRYAVIVVFAVAIWPMTFHFWGDLGRPRTSGT